MLEDEAINRKPADLVLVTGASGFIASHIIKQLIEQNETFYRVRGTVRRLDNTRKIEPIRMLFGNKIELVEADLSRPDGWAEALKDCKYVIHVASPFPSQPPANEDDLTRPAFDGTKFLLNACAECASLKRVVLTGSCSSTYGDRFENNIYKNNKNKIRMYSENDWAYFRRLMPYTKSKVVAERAAWEFIKERKQKHLPCFELAVLNPGHVLVNIF